MSRKLRRTCAAALFAAAGAIGACGDEGAGDPRGGGGTQHLCTPGESKACVGPAGCEGGQACKADGSGFEACDCGGSSTATGGAGGGGGAATSTSGGGGATTSGSTGGGGGGGFGGGGDGGAGGAGGAGVCAPGAVEPCYGGPIGTEGVGACKAGTRTCAADGASWGLCAGEVLPAPEQCATAEDEDCDGAAPPCPGGHVWSKLQSAATARDVTYDAAGNIYVTGFYFGTLDLGGAVLTTAGLYDVFVVKLSPAGDAIWTKSFGSFAGYESGAAIAVDGAGNVLVAGTITAPVDFGGGTLPSSADAYADVFVMKLDPSGQHLWSMSTGSASNQAPLGIAVDAAGNALVSGYFHNTVNFGGGLLTSAGSTDAFLVKLGPSGTHLWSKRFGSVGGDNAYAVAVDAQGNAVVTGNFQFNVDFGNGTLTVPSGQSGFVAKYAPGGAALWSKVLGSPSGAYSQDLALDAAGNIALSGSIGPAGVDFGGGPLVGAGPSDAFVVKLDPAGAHLWSKAFGDAAMQEARTVAFDAAGNIAVAGRVWGSIDLGGGPLVSAGEDDIYLAKLDPAGGHLWSKRFGDASSVQEPSSVAMPPSGVVLVGNAQGSLDFGAGPTPNDAYGALFIAKLAP